MNKKDGEQERAKEKKTGHEGGMEEKIFKLITNVFVGGGGRM